MKSKIKLVINIELLKILLKYTADNLHSVTQNPFQHLVKILINKLHSKLYAKYTKNLHIKKSEELKISIPYEEAYALDQFLSNLLPSVGSYEYGYLAGFRLKLNQAIQ